MNNTNSLQWCHVLGANPFATKEQLVDALSQYDLEIELEDAPPYDRLPVATIRGTLEEIITVRREQDQFLFGYIRSCQFEQWER